MFERESYVLRKFQLEAAWNEFFLEVYFPYNVHSADWHRSHTVPSRLAVSTRLTRGPPRQE